MVNIPGPPVPLKDRIPREQLTLSQLPQFLQKNLSFDVPVYTVWGACEDVAVLERFRSGEYKVNNLNVIDEKNSRLLDLAGVKLRLLGLGGALVYHKLFDNGEGKTTIAGGQGTMWTTILQIGELVDTARRVYDPSETRVLVTHASPSRDGLLNELSVFLKVDFSISAGLHFRYGSSYNEFSVNPNLESYRAKLSTSKSAFSDVWETVKSEVEPLVSENEDHKRLLDNALSIVNSMPSDQHMKTPFGGNHGPNNVLVDEAAFKNMWNFNLADAAYGWLVLEVDNGRIGTELKAQGFNFAHRGGRQPAPNQPLVSTPGPMGSQLNGPGSMGQMAQTQPRASPAPAAVPTTQMPLQNRANQSQRAQPQQSSAPRAASQNAPAPAQANQAARPAAAPPSIMQNAPSNQNAKPSASPAPNATSAPAAVENGGEKTDPKLNGTADEGIAPKETPPPTEKKPSQGIFMSQVNGEEDARSLIAEQDREKIQRVENRGRSWVVHFHSPEEMQEALERSKQEAKNRSSSTGQRPSVKMFEDRQGGRSGWVSRGGGQSGYRSGGGASDSDTNRRGGGPRRGGFRGRGGRGRGGFSRGGQGEGGGSNSPAP